MRKKTVWITTAAVIGVMCLGGCAAAPASATSIPDVITVRNEDGQDGKLTLNSSESVTVTPDMAEIVYGITTEETVVLLTQKRKSKDYKVEIEIPIDVDGSKTYTEEKSTYQNIKKFIKAKYGVNTHTKDIAEVKRDCGVEMRLNYNISKKENPKIRHCTQEKRGYIMDALEHYQVI